MAVRNTFVFRGTNGKKKRSGVHSKNASRSQNAYKKQYGIESNHLILTNLYGPYDEYGEYRSHVLGALIKRFCDAKKNNLPKVVCWGDGSAIRDFIYAGDCADGMIHMVENSVTEPVN